MSDGKIETINKDFFENVKEEVRIKPIFDKVIDADITDVSEVKYNPQFPGGENKGDKREYKKFYFTLTYLYKNEKGEPLTTDESYGFRFYEDKKTVWWGGDNTACGRLVNIVKKYTKELQENPSIPEVLDSFIDRKVKIITEEFGNSKKPKTMIDTFL